VRSFAEARARSVRAAGAVATGRTVIRRATGTAVARATAGWIVAWASRATGTAGSTAAVASWGALGFLANTLRALGCLHGGGGVSQLTADFGERFVKARQAFADCWRHRAARTVARRWARGGHFVDRGAQQAGRFVIAIGIRQQCSE